MTNIIEIPGLSKPIRHPQDSRSTGNAAEPEKSGAPVKRAAKGSLAAQDSITISRSAHNQLQEKDRVGRYLQQIQQHVTLGETELEQLRTRLENGEYSEPDVVTKIVADLTVPPPYADDQIIAAEQAAVPDEPMDPLEVVRSKVRSGDYDSDEVLDVIADRMIDPDNI